jgi:hypothetical protein
MRTALIAHPCPLLGLEASDLFSAGFGFRSGFLGFGFRRSCLSQRWLMFRSERFRLSGWAIDSDESARKVRVCLYCGVDAMGLGDEILVMCANDDSGMLGLLVMQRRKIPPVTGEHSAILGNG